MIKVSSNWSHIGGCLLPQCVQEVPADPDVFLKPDINNLVDEEKSIILSKNESSDYCEVYLKKFPQYKIQSISFVCNIIKVEIFQGPIMEYMETVYGVIVDEKDDQFKSYRYDVEIKKSGVTDLTLRFLTNSSEVCIFGFMLYSLPNPNGITSQLSLGGYLNDQNASQPRSIESKVSEKSLTSSAHPIQHKPLTLDQNFKETLSISNDCEIVGTKRETIENMFDNLKFYIDKRFEEFALHIDSKLAEIEERQNKKLDKLLHILENNK